MFKTYLSLLLFIFFLIGNNLAQETKVNSIIEEVTVFKKAAQVTRKGNTALPAGNSTLKFVGISPRILKESIQVNGKGDFTIKSVNHQLDFFEEPAKTAKAKELEKALDEKKLTLKKEQTKKEVLEEEEKLILHNNKIAGSQNGLVLSELKATANYYRQRLQEIKLEKIDIAVQLKNMETEIKKYQAQYNELVKEKGNYTSEIVVEVNSEKSLSADFVLKYVVEDAGWFPNYDLRVKDVESPVSLSYKAVLYQNSGEDWTNVSLTLSTGDFTKTGTKPELQPWRLDYYNNYAGGRTIGIFDGKNISGTFSPGQGGAVSGYVRDDSGEPLIGANVMVEGSTIGTITDINGYYSLDVPPHGQRLVISYTGFSSLDAQIRGSRMDLTLSGGVVLDEVVVTGLGKSKDRKRKERASKSETKPLEQTTTERVTTVEFKIELPYTIPSDGKQHIVQIADHALEASYEYYTVPKMDKDVFLTAQATNWEDFYLLSGEANFFFEGTYLGKSFLDVQVAEDTLDISLGRDKDIVVTRTKLKTFSKKQLLGKNRIDSRSFEIEVKNKKKQRVNITLQDQFPLSVRSEIEVFDREYEGATLDEKTGILNWNMTLNPGEIKKINFNYAVKYPKKKRLVLE